MEEHYAEHWPLQRYADELGLTTAHLNIICRRLANMSYKQLIFKRLLQEAKRFLLHRGQSVNHIYFTLGFQDPAYFSRFFSHYVGTPPCNYHASRLMKPDSGKSPTLTAKTLHGLPTNNEQQQSDHVWQISLASYGGIPSALGKKFSH